MAAKLRLPLELPATARTLQHRGQAGMRPAAAEGLWATTLGIEARAWQLRSLLLGWLQLGRPLGGWARGERLIRGPL